MATKQMTFIPGDDETVVYDSFDRLDEAPRVKTDAEKKTDAFIEALNDDPSAFLNVSRQSLGGNSPMEFVGRFPADKFDFGELQAHLQKHYGGGDYRCMLYAKGKVRANKLLTIAEKIKPLGTETNNGVGDLSSMLNMVLTKMEAMQRENIQILQQQQSGGHSRKEFFEELLMMKQFFDSGERAAQVNPIQQMRDVLALQEEMRGLIPDTQKDEDDGFGSLFEKLTPLIEAATKVPGQSYRPNPMERQPNPTNPANNPKYQQQQQKNQQMNMLLKMGIATLVKAARNNSDHCSYAEMVINQVPRDVIKGLILAPDSLNKLAGINKEVANYESWFLDLREHIKAQLGMPSNVDDLYDPLTDTAEGDTVAGNNDVNSSDAPDLHAADNPER